MGVAHRSKVNQKGLWDVGFVVTSGRDHLCFLQVDVTALFEILWAGREVKPVRLRTWQSGVDLVFVGSRWVGALFHWGQRWHICQECRNSRLGLGSLVNLKNFKGAHEILKLTMLRAIQSLFEL